MTVAKKIALEVEDKDTVKVFEDNYKTYGLLTLEDRAVPDYRDGLLKVYRRTLWAMHHIAKAKNDPVKTARVVGETIGKYHPHGDLPVAMAVETMVHFPQPLVEGFGNWGGQFDDAAAQRYTNCRLSSFATQVLFDPDYLAVVDLHPNYDGKDKEPELLPALLPHVILNGVFGIAVGLQLQQPSFEVKGVLTLLKQMLQGKKLTPSLCAKHLVFKFSFGGNVPIEGDNVEAFNSIMETGSGSLYAYCDFEVDEKAKTLRVTGIPPRKGLDTLIDDLRNTDYFSSVSDVMDKHSKTPADILCTFKKNVVIKKVIDDLAEECLWSKVSVNVAVVEREWRSKENKIRAQVHQWGVITLLENWLEWRKELEEEMLHARISSNQAEIAKRNLLLLAQKNRKLVAESWEASDQLAFLQSKLKVTLDEAKYICELRISQLAKLSREKLLKDITELKAKIASDQAKKKDISGSVLAKLESLEL